MSRYYSEYMTSSYAVFTIELPLMQLLAVMNAPLLQRVHDLLFKVAQALELAARCTGPEVQLLLAVCARICAMGPKGPE